MDIDGWGWVEAGRRCWRFVPTDRGVRTVRPRPRNAEHLLDLVETTQTFEDTPAGLGRCPLCGRQALYDGEIVLWQEHPTTAGQGHRVPSVIGHLVRNHDVEVPEVIDGLVRESLGSGAGRQTTTRGRFQPFPGYPLRDGSQVEVEVRAGHRVTARLTRVGPDHRGRGELEPGPPIEVVVDFERWRDRLLFAGMRDDVSVYARGQVRGALTYISGPAPTGRQRRR